jgi:hypothetical protein
MTGRISKWTQAREAYEAQGFVDDPERIEVKMNRLLPSIERAVATVVSMLLPSRPYLPLGAKVKNDGLATRIARLKTDLVDGALGDEFFEMFSEMVRMSALYCSSFIEPQWQTWIENIQQREVDIDPATGLIRDIGETKTKELADGLRVKSLDPWSVLPHPAGNTLDQKPWVILRECVTYDEMERLLEEKDGWSLPDDMTLSDLKIGPSDDYERMVDQWRTDLGLFNSETREDVIVLLRLYSNKRWLVTANYTAVLSDTENQNANMPVFKKPVAQMRWHPAVGPDRFWGKSEWERIQDVASLDDLVMSLYVDHAIMAQGKTWRINEEYLDPEDVTGEYGARLRIRNHPNKLADAIDVIDFGPPDSSLLEVHGIMSQEQDDRLFFQDLARGQAPTPKQTARATERIAEFGQKPLEFWGKYHEATTMPQVSYLVCKRLSENMSIGQMMKLGGMTANEALATIDADPENIPGGYKYEFQGSDRVVQKAKDYEQLIEGFNLVGNTPIIAQGPGLNMFVKKIMQGIEAFDNDEVEQAVPEEMLQQPPPPPLPPEGGPPVESMGATSAIQPPNQMATPESNLAAGGLQ